MSCTPRHPEPSANAPCTSTMLRAASAREPATGVAAPAVPVAATASVASSREGNGMCMWFLLGWTEGGDSEAMGRPDDSGSAFADDNARRHRVAAGKVGHDGRVGDTQPLDAMDSQPAVDYRQRVTAHSGGTPLVPADDCPVAPVASHAAPGHARGRR